MYMARSIVLLSEHLHASHFSLFFSYELIFPWTSSCAHAKGRTQALICFPATEPVVEEQEGGGTELWFQNPYLWAPISPLQKQITFEGVICPDSARDENIMAPILQMS